jgi:hypothetical protein
MNAIETTHKLDFEACPWPISPDQTAYRIGTCHGIYYFSDEGINLIVIHNDNPGNGHLEDVFEWFEYACRAQGCDLYIRSFFNKRFKKHCIEERGFQSINDVDVVKRFKK